ncbi:MAG: class I SAM-dependent methyltransferase [Proteobacteria bacterium]|nr:class I SAM-dependent methyltransferase [Pseudomonadota bacterium]
MTTDPIGNYGDASKSYAEQVDVKPIHVFYERPNTWALLPHSLNGLNILDLGCGSGWYAEQLLKAGAVVTAIDVNHQMVELTRKRVQNHAQVIQANLEEPLEFLASESFDVILAPLVIHYVKDWFALMKELARLLKKNGLFIFSTHQPHQTYHIFKLENYFHPQIIQDYWPSLKATVQYYHHTLHDLTESLYQAGFLIERMIEPLPEEGMKQDTKMYPLLTTRPWFLFVRAIKR